MAIMQRNFRQEDLPRIMDFKRRSMPTSFPGHSLDEERFAKRILKCAEAHPEWVQVLEGEGKIIGYVWFGLVRSDMDSHGCLHQLFIDESHRNGGLAERLLKHAEKYLASKGAGRMELKVTHTNGPALRLYGKMNYRKTRLVMEKKLQKI